jgi:hypothetical protein
MTAKWATDPTGQWKDMSITLMTGWNADMSPLRGEHGSEDCEDGLIR